jgi:hypothetical protein
MLDVDIVEADYNKIWLKLSLFTISFYSLVSLLNSQYSVLER